MIASNAGRIVRQMLYCGEVQLTESVKGTDLFIEQFREIVGKIHKVDR